MSARVDVEQIAEHEFHVRVIQGDDETSHRVTLRAEAYNEIAGGKADPAALVRRAVELLLSREHPKPIPPECDLTILARYFAEFERAKRNARFP
jgi:hypothetical protein